jgi:type I restriction enzyme, R subunit
MPAGFDMSESGLEQVCLEYFQELSWDLIGSASPEDPDPPRGSYRDAILIDRLRVQAYRLNAGMPGSVVDDAIARLTRAESADLMEENFRFHRLVTGGVPIEYRDQATGALRTAQIRLIDFDDALSKDNDFAVANQVVLQHDRWTRRADVVAYVNGIPLGLIELKRPGLEVARAYQQIGTYARTVPELLKPNAVCVIANGLSARLGTLGSPFEHYARWRTADGIRLADDSVPELETLIHGVFHPEQFLELIRDFIAFTDERARLVKRVAKYHQFHAVRRAVDKSVEAVHDGTRKAGVVWHTQGSGKSLEMLFLSGKLLRRHELANPTVVLVTDRTDLDDQLHDEVFAPARTLPHKPEKAESGEDLKRLLSTRASGGIIFTTMQKFRLPKADRDAGRKFPKLSDRSNIVVLVDEAHRTQYQFKDGLAQRVREALPNATFMAFTGTPISFADRDTIETFGDYIDVYDITQAAQDGATVPIIYEARLARLHLADDAAQLADVAFDGITESSEVDERRSLQSRWTKLEVVVGAEPRLEQVACDIVDHWEARSSGLIGKALIVCMSRRICIDLYDHIIRLRPDWHADDDAHGTVKVVITGNAADGEKYVPHVRTKEQRNKLKLRATDPDDPLELVIVRDMWLTGFDSPPLHTMYVDKPMSGASLMQAIARVNRTFGPKDAGLVIDYIGIADSLRTALTEYTQRDRSQVGIPIEQVRAQLIEMHEVLTAMLHECPWREILTSGTARARLDALAVAAEHIAAGPTRGEPDLADRFRDRARRADQLFALKPLDETAQRLRDDFAFFDAVVSALAPTRGPGRGDGGAMELALRQIVSDAITPGGVMDVYAAAGMERPDISILDDAFVQRLRIEQYPNLKLKLLERLLRDEIRKLSRTNVQAERKFSEKLQESLNRYTNRTLTAAEIIAELVEMGKELRAERGRAVARGLSDTELAFYDAICLNDSAVQQLGDETLLAIARELEVRVRKWATIDWTRKEQVRAKLRSEVKRLLRQHGYPPDQQESAMRLVIEQAERTAEDELRGQGDLTEHWLTF